MGLIGLFGVHFLQKNVDGSTDFTEHLVIFAM